MSDKLTISAGLSILMMAAYVLFGSQAYEASLGPTANTSAIVAQPTASVPGPAGAARWLTSFNLW
ncbi:hypothetical protein [Novosphingobium aquimarinum]|uniref:hypothetical protein n=1 Tax=Novosphingobium aquimarinum TaxID=2682494 RepID=UPI0012EC4C6F|nr:hypothetical protein [Novosphingobium aquimarinum]